MPLKYKRILYCTLQMHISATFIVKYFKVNYHMESKTGSREEGKGGKVGGG